MNQYFCRFFNLSNLKTTCTWTYVRERVDYKPRTKRFLALLQKYFIRYMVYLNVSKRQALSLFNRHYRQRRHFCLKKEELRYIRYISNTSTLMFYQFVFLSILKLAKHRKLSRKCNYIKMYTISWMRIYSSCI